VEIKKVYFIDLPVNNKPRYICDIAEKIYTMGIKSTIYCRTEQSAQLLDKLLWTWKQESFVPHTLNIPENQQDAISEPVIISNSMPVKHQTDALILFDPLNEVSHFSSYKIIIDLAETYNPVKAEESRNRYRFFMKKEDFSLQFVKLGIFLKQKEI
jgi:DNA polymerase-3 subunit chi